MSELFDENDPIETECDACGSLVIDHGDGNFEPVERDDEPGVTARLSVAFLLTRIGSWTSARWDQHLRNEIGDAAADEAIRWIERTFRVTEFGNQPASKPWAPHRVGGDQT